MTEESAGRTGPRLHHAAACALLVALTGVAFRGALTAEFVYYDDPRLVEKNELIRSLGADNVREMFIPSFEESEERSQPAWLPFRVLSYAVDYHFWGLNAFGYHLTNLALHMANVLLAYAVLVWVLRRPDMALLGAAWFAVHPVQVEAVTWVSGRRDVLYGFFALLTVLAFAAYERREGRWRWGLYAASIVCCASSLLSKASAMMLPAALVASVIVLGQRREGLRRRLTALAPHLVMAAAAVAVHLAVASSGGVVKDSVLGTRVASVPWALGAYLRLIFFPVGLATPYGGVPLAFSDTGRILASSAAVLGALAVGWWAASRRQVAVFGMAWWLLFLLPVSNVVPLSTLLAERYLYMPLLGVCIVAGDALDRLQGRLRRVGLVCGLAAAFCLAALTHDRQAAWQNTLSFWRQGVGEWPAGPVGRLGLGMARLGCQYPEQAWDQYTRVAIAGREAWSIGPSHVRYYKRGLRRCYDRVGRAKEGRGDVAGAIRIYQEALRLLPGEPKPRVRLGEAYERAGLIAKALQEAHAVKGMNPDWPGLEEWIGRLRNQGSR